VLWHCWLGGRKGIRPVKNLSAVSAGVVICIELGADLHIAQLMPLPLTVSCSSKIQIGFTFLVPAHPGSPRQRAVKRVCVCVCVCVRVRACVRACMRACWSFTLVCVLSGYTAMYIGSQRGLTCMSICKIVAPVCFYGPCGTFLAWPDLWEIHMEFCIKITVQFSSWFLLKSNNTPIWYKRNP